MFGAIVGSSIASLCLRRASRVCHPSGKNRMLSSGLKTFDVRSSSNVRPVGTPFANGRELRINDSPSVHHLATMLTAFPATSWNIGSLWHREHGQDQHPVENNRKQDGKAAPHDQIRKTCGLLRRKFSARAETFGLGW